jgi:hypothetical protein
MLADEFPLTAKRCAFDVQKLCWRRSNLQYRWQHCQAGLDSPRRRKRLRSFGSGGQSLQAAC